MSDQTSSTTRTSPAVVPETQREWETWPDDQVAERGDASWRTLISAGITASEALTLGVARLPPGGALRTHRHEQTEVYYVLGGTGVVTVDGVRHRVGPGDGVFIPGSAPHAVECTGATELRVVYVLAADSFEDVAYLFGE